MENILGEPFDYMIVYVLNACPRLQAETSTQDQHAFLGNDVMLLGNKLLSRLGLHPGRIVLGQGT
jgi:hypothetical protein